LISSKFCTVGAAHCFARHPVHKQAEGGFLFSNAWKSWAAVFQPLETPLHIFPMLGKRAADHRDGYFLK